MPEKEEVCKINANRFWSRKQRDCCNSLLDSAQLDVILLCLVYSIHNNKTDFFMILFVLCRRTCLHSSSHPCLEQWCQLQLVLEKRYVVFWLVDIWLIRQNSPSPPPRSNSWAPPPPPRAQVRVSLSFRDSTVAFVAVSVEWRHGKCKMGHASFPLPSHVRERLLLEPNKYGSHDTEAKRTWHSVLQ